MCSLLLRFTTENSYRSITLKKKIVANDRVECSIPNTVFKYWNVVVLVCIHEIFKPSIYRQSTRSQIALHIPLRKTNTGQKRLSFLGPKIWSKIKPSIKNVKHCLLLCMLLWKIFSFICKHKPIQIITKFLWSILLFDSVIATLFFLVIIGILLSRLSYFHLVLPPIFSY